MAQNADEPAADDSKTVTAQDLHDLKYGTDGVETSKEADEPTVTEEEASDDESETGEEDGKTDDQATDESEETAKTESDEDENVYVKQFPNIKGDSLEEYTKNLEKTVALSNTEGKRLSDQVKELQAQVGTKDAKVGAESKEDVPSALTPEQLYVKQKMDEEIDTAFTDFQKQYPQAVPGTPEYDQFVAEVQTFGAAILSSQKRLAPPAELYRKAAVSLGWQPANGVDTKERLNMAVKGSAATTKTSSSIKVPKKSKVTDAMIAINKRMYPLKSEEEIRKELEPYVQ